MNILKFIFYAMIILFFTAGGMIIGFVYAIGIWVIWLGNTSFDYISVIWITCIIGFLGFAAGIATVKKVSKL